MSAVAEEIKVEKRVVMLPPGRAQLFQHSNNRHFITAEEGTTMEDICKPEFLGHVAPKMRMYDEVVVVVDTGDFWARLLVLQAGPTWVRTVLLEDKQLRGQAEQLPADPLMPYDIAFKGPVRKWIVFRKADGQVVNEGMGSREEATRYMLNYTRTTTGG